MSRSIDQAPQDRQDNPNDDSQPFVHPERVDMRLPGDTSPAYADHQPQRIDARPNHRNRNRLIAGVGAVSLVAAGVFGGILLKARNDVNEIKNILANNPTATAPVVPGEVKSSSEQRLDPATTSPDVFAQQPYETILSETVPFLEERREESLRKIDEFYGSLGKQVPTDDIMFQPTEAKKRALVIERQAAADTYTITDVAMTQPILAENLARAVFRNPTSYEKFTQNDLDGKKHPTRIQVMRVSSELPQGMHFGTQAFEGPSFVLVSNNMDTEYNPDGSLSVMNRVFTEYIYDGDKTHYSLTYQIQEDNPYFTENVEDLTPPAR